MMVVPQGMAYASVAGLPVVYGLYTAFVPVMIHPWFTTSNEITVGPTAIVSVRVIPLGLDWLSGLLQSFT
jgi:sodium-independent sulfate anion transporter 11